MPATTITYITQEVLGRGFQKRALILDPKTGNAICQRVGGIPYATPLDASQRWKRAQPLPNDFRYGTRDRPTDCTRLANESPQSTVQSTEMAEDCLQMNIWIPEGNVPSEGWPVFFYIHGGFLQWGSPNLEDPVSLYIHTSFRAIFVSFSYRLNAFGFLASKELLTESQEADTNTRPQTTGNLGFWDQRLALEFVGSEIATYGGNPANITVAGLSAGAYSTFHQLAYSFSLPQDRALIRRVLMWSNGCGLQPKSIAEVQIHFDTLIEVLGIPKNLSGKEKLVRLRSTPWQQLAQAVDKVPVNAFRAVTDGAFVRRSLFAELHSGAFAQKLRERGIKVMAGDVKDEFNSYRVVSPPTSYQGLIQRLAVEYPEESSERLARLYCPHGQLPVGYKSWQDIFGRIYADTQVHVTQRGFISSLEPISPSKQLFRYRIERRAKCLDQIMSPEMGVAHGSDFCFWFWGHCFNMKADLTKEEAKLARALLEPLASYVGGEDEIEWGTQVVNGARKIGQYSDTVETARDPLWEPSLKIWRALHGFGEAKL